MIGTQSSFKAPLQWILSGVLLLVLVLQGGLAMAAAEMPKLPTELKMSDTVLLNFYANWCRVCNYMKPVVQQVEEKYCGTGLQVIYLDIDKPVNRKYAVMYQVRAVPTYVLYHKGQATQIETPIMLEPTIANALGSADKSIKVAKGKSNCL